MLTTTVETALKEWRALLGECNVITGPAAQKYSVSTLNASTRFIIAVLKPQARSGVEALVHVAARYQIPLYPISQGNNWGYGSSVPTCESVIVDLSSLKKIEMDSHGLGLVTVEPGVTIGGLKKYLKDHNAPFYSPHMNSGPNSSLIGNALERGMSATPVVDRFSSVVALEVILADGTLYRSNFSSPERKNTPPVFKWGIGPYIDGLFSQSNMGIVVRATFTLAPRPHSIEMFMAYVSSDRDLESIVETTREIMQKLGSIVSFANIQSPHRTFARLSAYPFAHAQASEIVPDSVVEARLHQSGLGPWVVMGTIQGEPKIVAAARKIISSIFSQRNIRSFLFSRRRIEHLRKIRRMLPHRFQDRFSYIEVASSFLSNISDSVPHGASRIPWWRSGTPPRHIDPTEIDYDADPTCGIIFFTTVLPAKKESARQFMEIIRKVCRKHTIEPLVNFHMISSQCILGSLPILFKRNDSEEEARAHNCYRDLAARIEESGAHLQRVPVGMMDVVVNAREPFWQVAARIKETLDPHNIISPDRYSSYRIKEK